MAVSFSYSLINLSVFVLIYSLLVRITIAESFYSYEEGGGGLLVFRPKRYVAEPISRLADRTVDGGRTSKDLMKGDLDRHRAEFIGSLAVEGLPEGSSPSAGGGSGAGGSPPPQSTASTGRSDVSPQAATSLKPEVTTELVEKSTKKATDKFPKKAVDTEKALVKPGSNSSKPDEVEDVGGYPKEVTNNTLVRHNITQKQTDNHAYYTSEYLSGEPMARHYWVDLENEKGVTVNEMLSKSHRRAATVRLSFDFPFYGHVVRNMTVATGGFLYTGDYIHSWLAATQYIAPLMANFDTSMSEDSFVKYRDNGTSFTVEWSSVSLQDKKEAGKFSFQVTLHQNGDIVFVYKSIPILVEEIEDTQHPVKVGLSDAYIIDKTVFYIRKKTIYEYHRVSFSRDDIRNWTVILMKALPTCVTLKDCYSCVNHNTTFSCKWCEAIGRCSSGFDRFLQDWSHSGCPDSAVSQGQYCSKSAKQRDTSQPPSVEAHSVDDSRETRLGHSGILGGLLMITFLVCLGLWVFHAYRNPHTKFGQMLIKYRPSQWALRRGEARYTAATIHM